LPPRLLLALEEDELGEFDDELAGADEGADDDSGCWLGWLGCESAGAGAGGVGCCARANPATLASASAHTTTQRIIEIPLGTRMNRSSPCPIRICGIV
jgi:hypothetical protein